MADAIHCVLYLQFGFVPQARNETEEQAWKWFFEKHGKQENHRVTPQNP